MSSITPPNIVSAALQSNAAQRTAATDKAGEEARAAQFSRELRAADHAVEVEIEATDADTRVHADAGGQGGGTGRHLGEETPSAPGHAPDADEAEGLSPGGLDISV